jgi:hypothetical protein
MSRFGVIFEGIGFDVAAQRRAPAGNESENLRRSLLPDRLELRLLFVAQRGIEAL